MLEDHALQANDVINHGLNCLRSGAVLSNLKPRKQDDTISGTQVTWRSLKLPRSVLRFAALGAKFRQIPILTATVLATIVAASPAAAAYYYVDGRVAQSGTGTDWSRAWKSFDAINWSRIKPGDVILISGGTSGVTYRGPLTVGAAGQEGKRIRIVRASAAGRNGPVVIDGGRTLPSCVVVNGFSHVTLEGFSVRYCTESAFQIRNAKDVVASRNSIFALSRGFHIWRTSNVLILNNSIATPTWDPRQNDGIYSQENVENRYVANRIVISNGYPDGHDDGIQSYRDRAIVISRNYVEQRNKKTGNALGIFVTDAFGAITVINNVVVGRYTRNSLVTLLNTSGTGGALGAYNNTLVGSKWGIVQIENAPGSRILNNILYSETVDAAGVTISGRFPPASAINYNLYYLPNGRPAYHVNGTSYQWNAWRALGYEGRGISTPTAPVDAAFAPFVGSPAIDSGLNLVQIDQLGRVRPRGPRSDMGGLEGPGS